MESSVHRQNGFKGRHRFKAHEYRHLDEQLCLSADFLACVTLPRSAGVGAEFPKHTKLSAAHLALK